MGRPSRTRAPHDLGKSQSHVLASAGQYVGGAQEFSETPLLTRMPEHCRRGSSRIGTKIGSHSTFKRQVSRLAPP